MKRPNDIKAHFYVFYGNQLIGETFALTARQAINNVRHNVMGETMSQYSDPSMWSAQENTGGFEDVKDTGL